MDTDWRIWFEVFKDGKKIGSGVYHKAYAYKKNAVRRAAQLWSNEGPDYYHNWIVSQTNPFAKGE